MERTRIAAGAIDLSENHRYRLPAACDAAIQSAFGAIPGVRLGDVTLSHPKPVGGKSGTPWLVVDLTGWAPTLHEATMRLHARPAVGPDDPGHRDETMALLEPALARQRSRAAAGLAHGISRPLALRPRTPDAMGVPRIETRHLHIDASLPALAVAGGDFDLERTLEMAIRELLEGDADVDGDACIAHDAHHMTEADGVRAVGTQVVIHGEAGRSVTFDGRTLEMHGRTVPETMLVAISGRRLGDLAALHPAIDGRIVRSAAMDSVDAHPRVLMELEPKWRPWTEIDRLALQPT